MHPKYIETVEKLRAWAQQAGNIQCALILGSQAREELTGDEWSDLDVLLLVDDPRALLQSDAWLAFLGEVVCVIVDEESLDWLCLTWSVKRVLFADNRAVDFSILPYERAGDVLAVNAEVHAQGYRVIYDAHAGGTAARVEAALVGFKDNPPRVPTIEELQRAVGELLFHLVYACKKIKRGELWVAVSCINRSVSGRRLLQLIEFQAASSGAGPGRIRYGGRFLEQRIPADVLAQLPGCFATYDAADAVRCAGHLIEFTERLVRDICVANGYPFDAIVFEQVRKIFTQMFTDEMQVLDRT